MEWMQTYRGAMLLKCFAAIVAVTILWTGIPAHAKPAASLEPYSGSYTGTAFSSTAAGALSGSATLTFTGRRNSLRGTFQYSGILTSGNTAMNVVQIFNISKKGVLNGRVTVGENQGLGSGQARMSGRKMTISVSYVVGVAPGTSINLDGTIVFKGKRATWTAAVTSSDPSYNGSLTVKGKR
jgi:hypothetical protein